MKKYVEAEVESVKDIGKVINYELYVYFTVFAEWCVRTDMKILNYVKSKADRLEIELTGDSSHTLEKASQNANMAVLEAVPPARCTHGNPYHDKNGRFI